MLTGFGRNRRRMELTGLEEPEELWDRLREATAEANALSAANKKLDERVRVLERQVAEAGALSDDELVAELPKRMSQALESAQAVAAELIRRAKKRAALIGHKADESARSIISHAEAEASSILARAAREAAAHIANAEAESLEVVRRAEERRAQVVAVLESETATLERRLQRMRQERTRLAQAYEVVERTLGQARLALGEMAEPSKGTLPESSPAGPPARANGVKSPLSPSRVYDWSPPRSKAR